MDPQEVLARLKPELGRACAEWRRLGLPLADRVIVAWHPSHAAHAAADLMCPAPAHDRGVVGGRMGAGAHDAAASEAFARANRGAEIDMRTVEARGTTERREIPGGGFWVPSFRKEAANFVEHWDAKLAARIRREVVPPDYILGVIVCAPCPTLVRWRVGPIEAPPAPGSV